MSGAHSVAIVDDAAEIRMLLRAQLGGSAEFDVCAEAGDGADAIVIARECRPDIMLLDLSMPRLGGLDALPAILAESPGTAVVILSGSVDADISARAAALGAAGCLTKTLRGGPFPDRLRAVLADH